MIGRPPKIPSWLANLKDGEYSLKQLSEISGNTRTYVCHLMKKYKVKKIVGRKVEKNMVHIRYAWSKNYLTSIDR